jgi:hypothetical protein
VSPKARRNVDRRIQEKLAKLVDEIDNDPEMNAAQKARAYGDLMKARELYLATLSRSLDNEEKVRRLFGAIVDPKPVPAKAPTDKSEITEDVSAAMKLALDGAVAQQDWKTVATVSKLYADVTGVTAPTKVEHSGEVASASPQEMAARVREALRHEFGTDAERAARGLPEPSGHLGDAEPAVEAETGSGGVPSSTARV